MSLNVKLCPVMDTMAEPNILLFIKFFQNGGWAEDFIKGKMYLNRLSVFKKMEALYQEDGRPDTNEAVAMWWQPHRFHMTLNEPRVGSVQIAEKDLAAPTSMSFEHHDHFHVLCLHSIYTSGLPFADGKFHLEGPGQIDELRKQIRIDPRCFNFGPHAVIINARPFIERFIGVLRQQGRKFTGGLVRYYDDTTFNGEIPRGRILFHKQKRFEYQREFRVAVEPIILGADPLVVDIGDISQFAGKSSSHKLNELLQVNLDKAA
jgi:hypothetical protein